MDKKEFRKIEEELFFKIEEVKRFCKENNIPYFLLASLPIDEAKGQTHVSLAGSKIHLVSALVQSMEKELPVQDLVCSSLLHYAKRKECK